MRLSGSPAKAHVTVSCRGIALFKHAAREDAPPKGVAFLLLDGSLGRGLMKGKPMLSAALKNGAIWRGRFHAGGTTGRVTRAGVPIRRLRFEPLEQRTLLSLGSLSGSVFEDLNRDGDRDTGEPGMAEWTVVAERTEIPEPLLTIPNPTPEVGDGFGCVAAVGDNILVGAPNDDTAAEDAGAAYLFDGTTGGLLRTFANPTPEELDRFGRVAALGNNVLVSATRDDTAGNDAGAVYLFDSTTGDLLQTFVNPTPAAIDGFGVSIAALGNNVIVGAAQGRRGSDGFRRRLRVRRHDRATVADLVESHAGCW